MRLCLFHVDEAGLLQHKGEPAGDQVSRLLEASHDQRYAPCNPMVRLAEIQHMQFAAGPQNSEDFFQSALPVFGIQVVEH